MPKFTVLKKFIDKESKEVYAVGSIIDLTAKRAKEIEVNLSNHEGTFIKPVKAIKKGKG